MNMRLMADIAESVSGTVDDSEILQSKSVVQYLRLIEWGNRESCLRMYDDHRIKFEIAKGSTTKHQAWEWWYLDHLSETMDLAEQMYLMERKRGRLLPFSLSDAILVLFLHDLEKPWKYAGTEVEKQELRSYSDVKDFIFQKVKEYAIELSDIHINALKYVHGEGDDYDPHVRVQWPLAAFVHICDTWSARIDFDYPEVEKRSVNRAR